MGEGVMNRFITSGFAVLMVLAAAAWGAPSSALAQAKPVKIALIAPLSGPWARQGYLKKLGAEMAVDEINNSGGIKALGGAKVELVIADAGDSAEKAKNAAQRIVSQEPDLTGGVGAWLSSFTLAVTEVTEREHLPWLSLSYADSITARGYNYVFQTSPTGGAQAETALPQIVDLAQAATGKRPTTLGIIMDNTAAPVSFTKPMREGELQKLGISLVMDEVFTPPLSDATSIVQKARSTRPNLIILGTTSVPDDKLVIEKLNEFGLGKGKIPVIGNGAHLGSPELLKALGPDQLEGVMFVVANWAIKGQEALVERFKKRTGEPWLTQDSASTYGEVWILKEGMERAKSANREKVAQAIHELNLTSGAAASAFAGGVKFAANGRRERAVVLIVQWQKGVPVTVYPPSVALAKPIWPKN
jgi:branched-chain amino acid transport system substrate-binding protein